MERRVGRGIRGSEHKKHEKRKQTEVRGVSTASSASAASFLAASSASRALSSYFHAVQQNAFRNVINDVNCKSNSGEGGEGTSEESEIKTGGKVSTASSASFLAVSSASRALSSYCGRKK